MKRVLLICGFLILSLAQPAFSQNDRFVCQTQINDTNEGLAGDAAIAFSHDGSLLAQHRQEDSSGNIISVWKVPTCELIWEWRNQELTRFFSVAFSPTDNNIVAFGTARRFYVYDISANRRLIDLRDEGANFLWFTDDRLITIRRFYGDSSPVKIYDTSTWYKLQEFGLTEVATGGSRIWLETADLSPDGKMLAIGWYDHRLSGNIGDYGEAHIWNVQTGERHCYNDNVGIVNSVDFSRDGSMIVIASTDGDRSFHYDYLRIIDSHTCEELYAHEMPIEWDMILKEARFLKDTQVAGILSLVTVTASQLYQPIFIMDFTTGEFLENWDWIPQNSGRTIDFEELAVSSDGEYFAIGNATNAGTSSLSLWKAGHISRVNTSPVPDITDIQIYPNPVGNYVKFDGLDADAVITVFDVLGRQVLITKKAKLDMSLFFPGIYLYTITSEAKQASGKLIKQ